MHNGLHDDGVPIWDDSIAKKLSTDETDIICWHSDHTQNRLVKGSNYLGALYYCNALAELKSSCLAV